ncbi:19846_t:CDS:1, partial [Racocetra persica]
HMIWIHNKLFPGTRAQVTACQGPNDSDETYDFEWSTAHDGFSLNIPNEKQTFWLIFFVEGTLRDPKKRGPFTNDKDYC